MKNFKLVTLICGILLFTGLIIISASTANSQSGIHFGNLVNKQELDKNGNPVTDKKGQPKVMPLSEEEIVDQIKKKLEKQFVNQRISDVKFSEDRAFAFISIVDRDGSPFYEMKVKLGEESFEEGDEPLVGFQRQRSKAFEQDHSFNKELQQKYKAVIEKTKGEQKAQAPEKAK